PANSRISGRGSPHGLPLSRNMEYPPHGTNDRLARWYRPQLMASFLEPEQRAHWLSVHPAVTRAHHLVSSHPACSQFLSFFSRLDTPHLCRCTVHWPGKLRVPDGRPPVLAGDG